MGADWAIAIASGEAASGKVPESDGPYLTTIAEIEEGLLVRDSLMQWEMEPSRTMGEVLDLLRNGRLAGGPRPPLSPEERAGRERAGERSLAAATRLGSCYAQMRARSGPLYERSRERSRIVSAAYRAAGSPRKVFMTLGPDRRPLYGFAEPWRRRRDRPNPSAFEAATEADADAWYAWWRERDRLRRAGKMGPYRERVDD